VTPAFRLWQTIAFGTPLIALNALTCALIQSAKIGLGNWPTTFATY
jgi:hypothetical protein